MLARVPHFPSQSASHDGIRNTLYLLDNVVFFAWVFNKKHYKYMVERVYLYRGNFIEFTFSNKIRRRLKNTEGEHWFHSPDEVMTPPHAEDGSPAWTQKGARFPERL